MTRSWYEIQLKAGSADIYLYDEIGLFGVSAASFVNEIRKLKGKPINLYLNSPGGDAFEGIAIYNSLKRHDAAINVTVDGLAASIASVIAQAGDTRTMAKGSAMMIHEGRGVAMGGISTMEKMAEELHLMNDNVASIYAERAGGTTEEWRGRMVAETWYNADTAQEAGLADAVTDERAKIAAMAGRVFNLSEYKNVPEQVLKANAANALTGLTTDQFNSEIKDRTDALKLLGDSSVDADIKQADKPGEEPVSQSKEDTMTDEIRQALGLGDEGDVIAAINALKSQAQDIATGEKGAENAVRKENAQLRQQLLTQESDYGQRIRALEDRNRQKEAAYAVDSAIQAGRVAPKDRELALKLALNDADGFEAFARNLRVDLNERGRMVDAQMAALEPTEDEFRLGRQAGLTEEAIRKGKFQQAGVPLPS